MGPIDYTIGGNLPSPTQSFLQGIQVVDALKAREMAQQQQAQAQEAEKQRQALMADLQAKARAGALGPGDFEAMKIADPKNYQAWDSSIQRLDSAKKDAAWANMSPVWYGLSLGTSEGVNTATEHLQTQLRAAENSGDKQTAQQVQGVLSAIATPEGRADILAKTGGTLNAIDPKRFKETFDNLMAVKGSDTLLAQKQAELSKATSEAEKSAIEAKYAEQEKIAELKNKAAQLGLTRAQTNSALAQGKKLGAETEQILLNLEAIRSGTLPPEKAFEQEEKLRKEFQTRTKTYQEVASTFANLQSSAKMGSGPGDIALITGFMKMLDPGSVVRETEFATARDTAGLYGNLQNLLEKAQNGQFLSPKQRQEYVSLSKQYYDSAQQKAAKDKAALGTVVKNYKLNPDNVFGGVETSAAQPAAASGNLNIRVNF